MGTQLGSALSRQTLKYHVVPHRPPTLRTPPTPGSVPLKKEPSLFPSFMDEKTLYLRKQPFIFTKRLTSWPRLDEAAGSGQLEPREERGASFRGVKWQLTDGNNHGTHHPEKRRWKR